jgi:hypothetical protein
MIFLRVIAKKITHLLGFKLSTIMSIDSFRVKCEFVPDHKISLELRVKKKLLHGPSKLFF